MMRRLWFRFYAPFRGTVDIQYCSLPGVRSDADAIARHVLQHARQLYDMRWPLGSDSMAIRCLRVTDGVTAITEVPEL